MRAGALPNLLSLFSPPACAVCASSCASHDVLCATCERDLARGTGLRLHIPGIGTAWAARPYDGVARELVAAIKFRRLVPATRRVAELISADAPAGVLTGCLVPVPADPLRAAWRGFDSAECLARELARFTSAPLSACLRRSRGARQVGRSRRQRLAAPPRVTTCAPPPARAVLVDDVTTTGATLAACAAALRSAGCEGVGAVVLAAARA